MGCSAVHNNNIFKNIYTCRTKVIFNVKQGKKIVFRDTSCLAGVSSSYNGLRFTDRQLIAAGQIRKGSFNKSCFFLDHSLQASQSNHHYFRFCHFISLSFSFFSPSVLSYSMPLDMLPSKSFCNELWRI